MKVIAHSRATIVQEKLPRLVKPVELASCGKNMRYNFKTEVEFSDKDKETFPWLNDPIRHYETLAGSVSGAHGSTYQAHVVNADGQHVEGTPLVALKLPNSERDTEFSALNVSHRINRINQDNVNELILIRKRLEGCRHANPIFDLDITLENGTRNIVTRTAQLYIRNGLLLKDWLVQQNYRAILPDPAAEKEHFHGIATWAGWRRVALILAKALEDVHGRRVIHGDVWPDNIFISSHSNLFSEDTQEVDPYAVLIDFQTAFLSMPSGDPKEQDQHPYRAPERGESLYVPTEQVDVYSYGQILMYLASGLEEDIPRDRYGRDRRAFIRDKILERNQTLLTKNPAVIDIIARCTALDPVARPKMRHIVKELERGSIDDQLTPISASVSCARLEVLRSRMAASFQDAEVRRDQKMYLRLADQKLNELESLINNCQTDQLEIGGTRDDLIDALVLLFKELGPGDAWTALTTPEVWQSSALGLDGRYATASVEAIKRDVSVRRVFALCIEEMGTAWAGKLAQILQQDQQHIEFQEIGRKIEACVKTVQQNTMNEPPSVVYMREYQSRIRYILASTQASIRTYNLQTSIFQGPAKKLDEITGFFLGLAPVATKQDVQDLRIINPASLISFAGDRMREENSLLVMTDIRGRVSTSDQQFVRPQMLGLRVYRSVLGYPKDRILALEGLCKSSINIGNILDDLLRCMSNIV